MTRKLNSETDHFEHEIERVLKPGVFIPYHACFSFVNSIDRVATDIRSLMTSDPERAITLFETFIACCYEKIEELDDSDGNFGQFVVELFCGWIKARQAAGANPEDTVRLLFEWMDHDPYGFCHDLVKEAVKVFDAAGLTAFISRICARFEDADDEKSDTGLSVGDRSGFKKQYWGEQLPHFDHPTEKKTIISAS